jgi:hypothetical protein
MPAAAVLSFSEGGGACMACPAAGRPELVDGDGGRGAGLRPRLHGGGEAGPRCILMKPRSQLTEIPLHCHPLSLGFLS